MLEKRSISEGLVLVKIVLWLLSTRLGTLVLCGTLSLHRGFPFINKFSDMSLDKREEVLKRWTKGKCFKTLRMVFLMVKIICFFVFFSMVIDSSPQNSSQNFSFSVFLVVCACDEKHEITELCEKWKYWTCQWNETFLNCKSICLSLLYTYQLNDQLSEPA